MVDVPRSSPPRRHRDDEPPKGLARRTVFSLSQDETLEFGRALARSLRGGELLLLEGELGLGKTVLAKGIAAGLGLDPAHVTSPTFTLVQEYEGGRLPLFHVDLYRLDDSEELGTIGIEEVLAGGGVVLVEWGEKLPAYLRRHAVRVRLYDLGEGSRRIEIEPSAHDPLPRREDA